MNCEKLENELHKLKEKIVTYINGIPDRYTSVSNSGHSGSGIDQFNKVFLTLYLQADTQNYYWQHCTFQTYQKTFDTRFREFLKTMPDASLSRFIKQELSDMEKSINNNGADFDFVDLFYYLNLNIDFLPHETLDNIRLSFNKKMAFLKNGAKIDTKLKPEISTPPQIDIDLSDMSRAEKIIFLNELGIIQFLKEKYVFISNNSLASIISGITGMNQKTAQSYINPIINTMSKQNKSPYNATSTVKKVMKKIEKLDL